MINTSDIRPVPDPTTLTTAALMREIAAMNSVLDQRFQKTEDVVMERFLRVDHMFHIVEQQRVEQKSDTKAAVDAALTAQKEAVREQTTASERAIAKSEAATARQLEQMGSTFQVAIEGLRRDHQDLKERTVAIEQQKVGRNESRAGMAWGMQVTFSVAALGLGAAGFIAGRLH